MAYTKQEFEAVVERLGEVFFVLDSGEQYIIHGKAGYSFHDDGDTTFVAAEGMSDGEYLMVEFPLDSIEHHYTHKEV